MGGDAKTNAMCYFLRKYKKVEINGKSIVVINVIGI